ncbi:MAG TPA: class E sortase [Actinomycetota bacterium]|nr:class E sortase [Actinomycetota bacterium]
MIGRSFIGLGVLILLFLGYQMFGTNFITGREQKALASDLATKWEVENQAHVKPDLGGGVALIKIPKIGVDRVVVEGVEVEHLKKGPGHYPETALPGQLGNMVISGHRTTYGAPFYRLDELRVGDEIAIVDAVGSYQYKVTETKIVRPTDLGVIAPSSDARLTLTTCHPRFSARQRLIVVAALQGAPRQAAA